MDGVGEQCLGGVHGGVIYGWGGLGFSWLFFSAILSKHWSQMSDLVLVNSRMHFVLPHCLHILFSRLAK
jgi:hypothetical protein